MRNEKNAHHRAGQVQLSVASTGQVHGLASRLSSITRYRNILNSAVSYRHKSLNMNTDFACVSSVNNRLKLYNCRTGIRKSE